MPPLSHTLMTSIQLGSVLQAARRKHGLTQAALAGRIGLSQSRVSHLELHAEELSVEQLLTWCAVLDLELTIGTRESSAVSNAGKAEW
ncbi:MAG: helix-turn-helix transcriptional regulator [Pusillimonas sp.]|nr:helix-turn-helix transcriptional regulator [Pusillimonas sp.]MDX3895747.1 helix-turn-helix transcriptional regulator [Pusillimonas sp.]